LIDMLPYIQMQGDKPMIETVQTFSYGMTPPEVIKAALGDESYPMELVGEEAKVVEELVNQGIDSHLEAVLGEFNWDTRKTVGGFPVTTVLKCNVSPDGMICLLRRLDEHGSDEAMSLRTSILSTLDIEEV